MDPTAASASIVTTTIFPVLDMAAASAFYRGLGFTIEAFDEHYAFVRHGDREILHLQQAAVLDPVSNGSGVYLHVDDADAWHARWTANDVALSDIADEPWGMREFSFTDPSGNLIRVGHNL